MINHIKQVGGRAGMALAFAALVVVGSVGASFADSTDPVDAGFQTMQDKITTYGAAIVALVVLSVGIFLGLKYLRKGVSKA